MSNHGHSLRLAFDTDEEQFVLGFEAASVYHAAEAFADGGDGYEDDECLIRTVHSKNAEMMLRIAEACGMAVRSEEVNHGWMHVIFDRPCSAND